MGENLQLMVNFRTLKRNLRQIRGKGRIHLPLSRSCCRNRN
jgi:hypothetical protein